MHCSKPNGEGSGFLFQDSEFLLGFHVRGGRWNLEAVFHLIKDAHGNPHASANQELEGNPGNLTLLSDIEYMNRALDLAERGRGTTSPNPMVGAVIVRHDGTIVGQGYHEQAGGPHAEVRALDEAGDLARGAFLYCTLEPCCHVGRTGPCVERVTAAGIARVVAATVDADPRVSGRGFDFLRQKGIDVAIGPGRERALRLNRAYFTFKTTGRPFVIMKAATSHDNKVAAGPGQRTQISSDEARRHAHSVRAEVDAIAVGSETVLVDDPALTVRGIHRRRPLTRVLFDRRLRIPLRRGCSRRSRPDR